MTFRWTILLQSETWHDVILELLAVVKLGELIIMATKGAKNVIKRGTSTDKDTAAEDIFGADFDGEFGAIPQEVEAAIGAIARLAVINGGYFGLSVTDDRVSCRFVLRTGRFTADKRLYRLSDLNQALQISLHKLRG